MGYILQQISLSQAVCKRSGEALFAPVSFTVKGGELVVIAGPNGAGKTTLLETLAGLRPLSSGNLSFEANKNWNDWLENSHYLGHKLGNKGILSCLENLKFVLEIYGHRYNRSEGKMALEQVGLNGYEYQLASELSAGQKKRLALSRLLLLKHSYWLLDEPFVNLDQMGCEWLYQLIKKHINQGGSVILTAHDQQKIHQMASQHIILEQP